MVWLLQTISPEIFEKFALPIFHFYWYFSRKYLELQLRTSARITLVTKLSCLVLCALIPHRNASCLFHYITTIHFVIIPFQSLLFIYHVIFRSVAVLHASLFVILLFLLITEVAPSKFSHPPVPLLLLLFFFCFSINIIFLFTFLCLYLYLSYFINSILNFLLSFILHFTPLFLLHIL